MSINFTWERETAPPFPGLKYRVGKLKWPIGSVHLKRHDLGADKDPRPYECWTNLPGLRVTVSRHFTEEKAKLEVERTVQKWFDMVLDGNKVLSEDDIDIIERKTLQRSIELRDDD